MSRSRVRRCLVINSPSIILLVWAVGLALGYTGSVIVRIVLMVALAVAFVLEERAKWRDRRRRRERESGPE